MKKKQMFEEILETLVTIEQRLERLENKIVTPATPSKNPWWEPYEPNHQRYPTINPYPVLTSDNTNEFLRD